MVDGKKLNPNKGPYTATHPTFDTVRLRLSGSTTYFKSVERGSTLILAAG
jgi:hypothetical protein